MPDTPEVPEAVREHLALSLVPGSLGIESARGDDGLGITVSYWASLDEVGAWGRHAEHLLAQQRGREQGYQWYTLRVCRVEHARTFDAAADS